jgi:maltose alpha-D-glucosyltransferase/alpha-amylase
MQRCRWFAGKAHQTKRVRVGEVLPLPDGDGQSLISLIQVEYMDRDSETYTVPLAFASGDVARKILQGRPESIVTELAFTDQKQSGVLYDALIDEGFCRLLLQSMARRGRRKGKEGELQATSWKPFKRIRDAERELAEPFLLEAEQSNSSIVFGKEFILKLFRKVEAGINPDLEIGRFLTDRGFEHSPPVAGALEYFRTRDERQTLAILHGFVPNQGDAWEYTLHLVGDYLAQVMAQPPDTDSLQVPAAHPLELAQVTPPDLVFERISGYGEVATLLGRRTAELHVLLSSVVDNPNFAPEPFSKLYQRSLYQSARALTVKVFQLLRKGLSRLPESLQEQAVAVLEREPDILERFRSLTREKLAAMRLRCHGDLHLGQVLWTGRDFVIMDFEGEPARPIHERRIKRSPLRDVAGMLRSFHYAAFSGLSDFKERRGLTLPQELTVIEGWAHFWYFWAAVLFLRAYMERAERGQFLPESPREQRVLLDLFLLEKAVYELGYELNNRPHWVKIPLQGILHLLSRTSDDPGLP